MSDKSLSHSLESLGPFENLAMIRKATERLDEQLKHPPARHSPDEWTTVILADLTDPDWHALRAAGVSFSGENSSGSGPYGHYMATFLFELPKALRVLGWSGVVVVPGHSFIVRRERRGCGGPT